MITKVSNQQDIDEIIAERHIVNIRDKETQKYISTKMEYTVSLMNKQSPINYDDIKVKSNITYLKQIVANVSAIPTLRIPTFNIDNTVFHAEPIDILQDDSKGLKQDIRRFNKSIASWTCDHSWISEKESSYQADLGELALSDNYKAVKDYLDEMARACMRIKYKDDQGLDYIYGSPERDFSDDEDDYFDDGREDRLTDTKKAREAIESANKFKIEVLKFKAKYQQTKCPICARHKSEYENMLREVEERRQEAKDEFERQVKAIQDSEDENIEDFIEQYFPGKTKLKVMNIVKMWKLVKKEMIKQDEIAGMLEETGNWTITNSHNIKYAQHK